MPFFPLVAADDPLLRLTIADYSAHGEGSHGIGIDFTKIQCTAQTRPGSLSRIDCVPFHVVQRQTIIGQRTAWQLGIHIPRQGPRPVGVTIEDREIAVPNPLGSADADPFLLETFTVYVIRMHRVVIFQTTDPLNYSRPLADTLEVVYALDIPIPEEYFCIGSNFLNGYFNLRPTPTFGGWSLLAKKNRIAEICPHGPYAAALP